MKDAKDLFSKQAATYAAFRPVYPAELYEFLFSITRRFDAAWDCGTGNGQVAVQLAKRFAQVNATDISAMQIEHAQQRDNIKYEVARAEDTPFADSSFDLVTVGTAMHWFDLEHFYKEVNRVTKAGAHLAAWSYAPTRSQPAIDSILDDFCYNFLKDYWDPERRYVDEEYKNIPFPFEEVAAPRFEIKAQWKPEQLIGYISSWSAVQHYIKKHDTDPIPPIAEAIHKCWPADETREIRFPLFMRVGKVVK